MSDDTIEINVKGIDSLLKALKEKIPTGRVGILGNKNARNDGPTNAFIGLQHEFGNSIVPMRSFLRVPLMDNLNKTLEKNGAFTPDVLTEVIMTHNIKPWIQLVTITAESIVLEAFSSNGFGKWAPWAKGYSSASGQILVDTNQLRDSITSEVVG